MVKIGLKFRSLPGSLLSLWLPPGCGNLQVLLWGNSFPSPDAKPRIPSARWWAGYANLPLSSAFHLALTKASSFTEVQARPCSTPLQGHSTMHSGQQGPAVALPDVSVGLMTCVSGVLYPPAQVSTATVQDCLYSCDACTLRAHPFKLLPTC